MKEQQQITWLSGHLFYAGNLNRLLIEAVKPFVERALEEGLAQQWFFIRYGMGGPHIRLRFKGEPHLLETVLQPRMEAFFGNYFQKHPSFRWPGKTPTTEFPNNSIQFIPYEPEMDRYGGVEGITISEAQFEYASAEVLERIGRHNRWDGLVALNNAIPLHLELLSAFGMSTEEMEAFFREKGGTP